MLNEWSINVPAHCRYELLSVGALMIFIFFGGIASTALLILLLVSLHLAVESDSKQSNHSLFAHSFSRFMATSICKFCAFHIWFFIISILIHHAKEVVETGKTKKLKLNKCVTFFSSVYSLNK